MKRQSVHIKKLEGELAESADLQGQINELTRVIKLKEGEIDVAEGQRAKEYRASKGIDSNMQDDCSCNHDIEGFQEGYQGGPL